MLPVRTIVILVTVSIVLLLSMGMRHSFGLFQTPIAESFGIGFAAFSLSLALQNLLWGLSQPVVGALADKYGSGRIIAVAALAQVLGLLMLANADSIWELHVSTGIIIGIAGSGTTWAVLLSVVARNVPENRRSFYFGLCGSMGTGGQILIAPLNQFNINNFGWVNAVLILTIFLAVVIPLAIVLKGRAADHSAAREHTESMWQALDRARKHSGYLYLTAGFFVCGFHVAFIMSHLPNYLLTLELPEWLPGAAISTIGATNLIGTLTFGWLGDRYSKKYLLSLLYFLRAIVFAGFLIIPISVESVLVLSAALGLLWLATVPLTNALVGHLFGLRYLAMLAGIVFASHQLGSFISVWLAGWMFDVSGSYSLVWQISVGLGLLAAILHLPIDETPPERVPAPAAE